MASPAFVQKAQQSSATTNHVLVLPSVGAGSFLIAFVRQSSISDLVTSFSDDLNGAWTRLFFKTGSFGFYCYYRENSAAGTVTVTAVTSSSNTWRWGVLEYSGAQTSSAIDVSGNNTFTATTTPTTSSITTTQTDTKIVSAFGTNSAYTTESANSGETNRIDQSFLFVVQDENDTSPGGYTASILLDASIAGIFGVVAIKNSSAATPVITNVDGDNNITSTQTGIVITGTSFGADGANAKIELVDGAIVSLCTKTAWADTSITFTAVKGDVRLGSGRTIKITTDAGLTATKTVTLSAPSGQFYNDISTLKTLTFDARGRPSRFTPKGTAIDGTADCTGAVQIRCVRTGGSGNITIDTDGRIVVADTVTTMDGYWHNGTVESAAISWEWRGDFPDCTSPTVANLKFTQNSAISSIDFSTRFEDEDTVVGSRVHTLQGGSVTGLSLSSAGVLTGTPTAIATTSGLKIRCADEFGSYVETDAFSIQIEAAPNPPFFSGTIPPLIGYTGQTFTSFDTSTFATFDTGYTIAPTLPAGLSFNTGTGVISGTPTTAGVYTGYVVTYTGTGTPATSNSFQIEIITIVVTNTVPNVIGLDDSTAAATMGVAGLAVSETSVVSLTVRRGAVISQSPAAGTDVEAGSTVDLVISLGGPANSIAFSMARRRINELSYLVIGARFRNRAQAEDVVPSTVQYRVDCATTGVALADWTLVTPATLVNITVTPSQNSIQNDTNRTETKQLTVMTDAGLSTQFVKTVTWRVQNLTGVR